LGRKHEVSRELPCVVRLLRSFLVLLALGASIAAAAAALVIARDADRRVTELSRQVDAARGETRRSRSRSLAVASQIDSVNRRLKALSHPMYASLSWPVDGMVLSEYGQRGCCMHPGIDLDGPAGAAVRAAAVGVVTEAGWESGYGNRVIVDHGRGLKTLYAHLAAIGVRPGVLVTRATVLGSVGCTGTCYGTHLHFEVRLNGQTSDPHLWLPELRQDVAALQYAG
jgi:murein DD-endopeptidase MepM/ murein hydrolase activator NlpD